MSTVAVDDQVRLGRLKVIPLKGLRIERTLWQLKTPGRLDIPAATAFERIIREPVGERAERKRAGQAQSGLENAKMLPAPDSK